MADRFTAEQFRTAWKADAGWYAMNITNLLTQAADTEEKVEKIASADPALVEEVLSQNEDGKWDKHLVRAFLIALAAVLKGEAT
jgi:hypothetical protein